VQGTRLTQPKTYQRATLPNGIRLITVQMSHVRSSAINFIFGVGARHDAPEHAGMAHFLEHMFFKGSRDFPTAQAISEAIEGVGGVEDAATDKETTAFFAKVASRHFDHAMHWLTDLVRRPLLEAAELEKERRVIVEEIGMYRDSPGDWVHVLADETLWPNLPLGREVAGTRETVRAITPEAMAAYHASHYVPGNLVISVGSDLPHERALEAVTNLLGDWEARPVPQYTPSPPPLTGPRVRLERRKTEQSNLSLLTPALRHDDPRYFAMILLNAVLGEGMSSRLFLEVRERQGLAYDVGSGPIFYNDTGAFSVSAGVDPARTPAALRAILGELRRMCEEPVPAEELGRAKEYSKGRRVLRLEDPGSVAAWLAGQEITTNEILELDEVLARLDAVTAEDIQALAREIFAPEKAHLAVIGPHKDAGEFERALGAAGE